LSYLRCIASLVVFSAVLCTSSISISGDNAVGRITALQGPVTIKRPGQAEPVNPSLGDGIAVGDIMRTGDGGRAQIALNDESFMNLSGDASLRINQYSFDEKENRRKAVVRVLNGKLRFVVFMVRSPESNFRVETDTASIVVDDRCDIVVDATPALTSVAVLDKSVRVKSAFSYVIGETRLGVNQSVTVSAKKPPSTPGLVSPDERRQYLRELSRK
jgi:ferric-dicitrate binding protein FerR (iron transport regulator)